MVKLYALSTCSWCKKTKKLLDDKSIAYDCIDVDLVPLDQQEIFLKEIESLVGRRTFPVTVVGTVAIPGYEPKKILGAVENEG